MKKKLSLALIITGSVVAALVVAIIVLSVVTVKPFDRFMSYSYVNVYAPGSTNVMPKNDESVADVKEGLEKTNYSIMHGLLEIKYNYGLKLKTEKDEDGKTQFVEKKVADINALTATSDAYLLEFVFTDLKTIKVSGETIEYDRIKALIPDFGGEIGQVELYLYNSTLMSSAHPDSEYYTVSPVLMYAYTHNLYEALEGIADYFN